MTIEIITGIIIFIFGLVFGSFYNVVGYRLPNKSSISFPPSHCVKCNHKLKFYELIPLFSYIFLRGKCNECKGKISVIYPIFEFLTGLLFCASYIIYGFNIEFFISITFISILLIITISDIRYFIIPDEVIIFGGILIVIELLLKTLIIKNSIINGIVLPLLNGAGSFAVLYLFKVLGDNIFKKESLGGGDIKLMFIIGLVLGFDMSIVTVFFAAFIALPLSMYSLIKEDNNILPFGPYLSLASIVILLTRLNIDTILNILVK